MRKIYLISLLSLFILLNACAPPKPAPEPPENESITKEKREKKTKNISSWTISGGMAAKSQNKAWTATINWRQRGIHNYQIRLFGPVGGGSVMIERAGSVVTYKDGPKTVTSSNADELLRKQTGIRLPVSHLYYWVRGLPAPGSIQTAEYDRYNHLTELKQRGYTIRYAKYTSVEGVDLPSRIRLQGHGVMMKLVIKRWSV